MADRLDALLERARKLGGGQWVVTFKNGAQELRSLDDVMTNLIRFPACEEVAEIREECPTGQSGKLAELINALVKCEK